MKAFLPLFTVLIGLSLSTAYASGWGDFAKGFAETTAATQEQRKCERTYSRAVCEQMEVDKKEKEAQEDQLRAQQQQINDLESRKRQLENENQQLEQEKRNSRRR